MGTPLVTNPRADMMVELIQQYSDLMISIERTTNKQLLVQVDYPTDDFPKEISERLEMVSRCDKYLYALSVKDHMLWLALNDKEKAEEAAQQEKKLSFEYAEEMNQWAELASELKMQLKEERRQNEAMRDENNKLVNLLRAHGVHYTR
jgi:GTP-sensing pleiotropic transcriptional regulator CodY